MNPWAELALILALFAALVALSYAMRWWRERHPVVEVVAEPPQVDAPQPFANSVVLGPAFYDDIPEDGEQEED